METAEATSILIGAGPGNSCRRTGAAETEVRRGSRINGQVVARKKTGDLREVKGECIYVYVEKEQKALETVKHEFLDYLISKTIEPYQKIANKLIGLINDEAYARKEKLVEILADLI